MRAPRMRGLLACLFALLVFGFSFVQAQEAPTPSLPTNPSLTGCQEEEEIRLLNDLNTHRISRNVVPLVTNPILCQIAYDQAIYRATLSLNTFLTTDNEIRLNAKGESTTVSQWALEKGYPSYTSIGAPNIRIGYFVTDQLPPLAVKDSLIGKWGGILSTASFREVGFAYVHNQITGYYLYFIVLGSRPNVLPVFPVDSALTPLNPDTPIPMDKLHFALTNESFQAQGSGLELGQVTVVNISELPPRPDPYEIVTNPPTLIECTLVDGERQTYNFIMTPPLSSGAGLKTFYIRMCDANDRMIISELKVSVVEPDALLPTPDPLLMTQTALAGIQLTLDANATASVVFASQTSAASTIAAEFALAQAAIQGTQTALANDAAAQTAVAETQAAINAATQNAVFVNETGIAILAQTSSAETQIADTIAAQSAAIANETGTAAALQTQAAIPTSTPVPIIDETGTALALATAVAATQAAQDDANAATLTASAGIPSLTPVLPTATPSEITSISCSDTCTIPLPDEVIEAASKTPWLEMVWNDDRLLIKNILGRDSNPRMIRAMSFMHGETTALYLGNENFQYDPMKIQSCLQFRITGGDSTEDGFKRETGIGCLGGVSPAITLNGAAPWSQDFTVRFFHKTYGELDLARCFAAAGRCIVPYVPD